MAKRTQVFSMIPWTGGVNTSLDESLLPPNQLTVGDNLVSDYSVGRKRREGINYNWDDGEFQVTDRESTGTTRTLTGTFNTGLEVGDLLTVRNASNAAYNITLGPITAISPTEISYTAGSPLSEASTPEILATWGNKVVGGIDYWFGNEDSRAHYIISVLDNGAVYRTLEGNRERIPDGGQPWTIPASGLTEANLEILNNLVIIAVSGPLNQMKYWNGDPAQDLRDLPSNLTLTSVSRASSGTVRTLVFSGNVTIPDGDTIVINSGPDAYNGTFTLLSGSGTTTITYDAGSTLAEATTPDTDITIGRLAPLALFLRTYKNKLFSNDKQNLDRLHYSATDNPLVWGDSGSSDAGAFDIGIGDGDPAGLTGIAPPFKGDLFVGKRTKLYRLPASADIELTSVVTQSTGIGFISHQGITSIDQDDVFFVSDRGFHSLNSTNAYGDFTASFISSDIQRTFVEQWSPARKKYIKAAYFPELNSAAFAVTEGSTFNNALWLFNVPRREWTRWPDIEAEALIAVQDLDRRRAYFGTLSGRLARTLTGSNVDTDEQDVTTTIQSTASSGLIYLENRPDVIRGFKKLSLIYRGSGSYTITAKFKIDNFSEQAVAFTENQQSAVLGAFVLGEDILGGSFVTAPYTMPIDGYGRGFRITVQQNDLNTGLIVLGFMVEFEVAGDSQETRLGDSD